MLTVIDLGLGNVGSVSNALRHMKIEHTVTYDHDAVAQASRLIFPGVGSFHEASERLIRSGMRELIRERVLAKGVPILGICLGMQLLASEGEEGGLSDGLGLLRGRVTKLCPPDEKHRLPHVGWNDVTDHNMAILNGIEPGTCFYFVHSYAMNVEEPCTQAHCEYGTRFIAAIQKGHVCGTQFHPEKSREAGLRVLRAFTEAQF